MWGKHGEKLWICQIVLPITCKLQCTNWQTKKFYQYLCGVGTKQTNFAICDCLITWLEARPVADSKTILIMSHSERFKSLLKGFTALEMHLIFFLLLDTMNDTHSAFKSSQMAKFWTVRWILGKRKRSMPSCPECISQQLPVPKRVFSWLYFLYVVGVISFTSWPGCCSWTICTSTAVWLPGELGGGQEEAGGGGFASAKIRGGIRKYHLGVDPPFNFPPEAAASCCFLLRGDFM